MMLFFDIELSTIFLRLCMIRISFFHVNIAEHIILNNYIYMRNIYFNHDCGISKYKNYVFTYVFINIYELCII